MHAENPNSDYPPGTPRSDLRTERTVGVEAQEDFGGGFTEHEILGATDTLAGYLRQQRAHYYPLGQSLGSRTKSFLARFFDPSLLGLVRVVKLAGERVPNPPFFETAKKKGFKNLPDLTHQSPVTFLDVIVFNQEPSERALFHGLVQATQVQLLGVERFAEFLVRGSLRTKSYMMIPLKAHAFSLDCQFAEHRERGFSVETDITRWLEQGRY